MRSKEENKKLFSEMYLEAHTHKAEFMHDTDGGIEARAVLPTTAKHYGEIVALEAEIALYEFILKSTKDFSTMKEVDRAYFIFELNARKGKYSEMVREELSRWR